MREAAGVERDFDRTAFEQELRESNVRTMFTWGWVFNIGYLAWSFFDYVSLPELWPAFSRVRFGVALIGAVALTGPYIFKSPRWSWEATAVGVAAWLLGIVWMLPQTGPELGPYVLGLSVICLGTAAVPVWPTRWAVGLMLLSLVAAASVMVGSGLGLRAIVQSSFLYGSIVIGSAMLSGFRYSLLKSEFVQRSQLKEANAQVEQSLDRERHLLEQRQQFFNNVSHELRTPLTLSLGPLKTVLSRMAKSADRDQLETVQRNQLRLLHLINQLLDLAKLDAGKETARFAPEDASDVVRIIAADLAGAAKDKGLSLEVSLPGRPIEVHLDRLKFERVLLNLLSNAFKFTPAGGSIALEVSADNRHASFAVEDSGIGIAPDKLHTVFDRFAQVDGSQTRKYAGTGIGLSLVKQYTELHGGTVEVTSQEGKGTRFTVRIPLGTKHLNADDIAREPIVVTDTDADAGTDIGTSHLREELLVEFQHVDDGSSAPPSPPASIPVPDLVAGSARSAHPAALSAAPPQEPPTIVVVDDTPDMRRYIKSLLAPTYRVITAKHGKEGLDRTREYMPDLVLSDVMMPVMSGGDLCRTLKADPNFKDIPVVLVTARAEEQTRLKSLDYGADDYLLKPFLQEELLLRVRNLVSRRLQQKALQSAHVQLREQQSYMDLDLDLARKFQQSLLTTAEMPDGLHSHVEFHPADAVGGDFYHMMRLGPTKVRVLLADMADHGVKAAIRASAAWPEYTSLPHDEMTPADVLQALNHTATSKYSDLSGCFLCLDLEVRSPEQVTARYAQAGEAPMTIVDANGWRDVPPASGFILGLFPGMRYEMAEFGLAPGERLFLFTDGLYTQTNEQGDTFRTHCSDSVWNTARGFDTVHEAASSVYETFTTFRGECLQQDDATIVGISILGETT